MNQQAAAAPPQFPVAAMRVVREEVTGVPLKVLKGALPLELSGHLFMIAPAGNIGQSGAVPNRDALLNGDGMVYRVDFKEGTATGSSRIVKPLDYWADTLTQPGSELSALGFRNAGISRVGLLGFRNFGNTALLPLYTEGQAARLLVTYDAGRPLLLDPVTLQTLGPVGADSDWMTEMPLPLPFKLVLTSAHPVWDPKTQQLFTTNYSRSLGSLLWPKLAMLETERVAATSRGGGSRLLATALTPLLDAIEGSPLLMGAWHTLRTLVGERLRKTLRSSSDDPSAEVRIVRWNGKDPLQSWKVVLPSGDPVEIEGSMHQIALTEDYVVLLDTNFKVGLNQWINNPFPNDPTIDRVVRLLLAHRQAGEMLLYIVPRKALDEAPAPGATVVARQVRLPYGAVHFLSDYQNPDGQITLHVGHGSALDIAEWLRSYDSSPAPAPSPVPPLLVGMVAGEVDVSHVGRYVIDAATGQVREARLCAMDPALWGLSLYAAAGVPAWNELPARIEQLFWFSSGFWPQLLTRYIYGLYATYEGRMDPTEWIQSLALGEGAPPCLFRLDTQAMQIVDRYPLDGNRLLSSPQFIPNPRPGASWADGWVVCTVVGDDEGPEVWVFRANDLHTGPVARLGSEQFPFAFTLHTAWMPVIASSTYAVDERADLEPFIAKDARLGKLVDEMIRLAAAARATD